MNSLYRMTALLCLLFGGYPAAFAQQEDDGLRSTMHRAYAALKDLQPFLYRVEQFESPTNRERVASLIGDLRKSFHGPEKFKAKFRQDPAFRAGVVILGELLDDAASRFKEGRTDYALFRLRTVTKNCGTCHTTYKVRSTVVLDPLTAADSTPLEKAEFYTASRQVDRARAELENIILQGDSPFLAMQGLRRWLVQSVRITGSADETAKSLIAFEGRAKLTPHDREEVKGWIASAKRWAAEKPPASPRDVDALELMVMRAIGEESRFTGEADTVSLLRATAELHEQLERPGTRGAARAKALRILGISYLNLRLYFVDELPQVYFKQCIEENPGSDEAKKAYRVYREMVLADFTGSAGTALPADVGAELDEYYRKANDIPGFNPTI